MRVLTHVCCGPCFTAVHELLDGSGHDPTVFYFNPNIHPPAEYRRRLAYVERFCRQKSVPLLVGEYELPRYFRAVHGAEDKPLRCTECYRLRLGRTAEMAAAGDYDAFTTSLLLSPYQFHESLKEAAESAAREQGVVFLYQDWRRAYRRSIELSRAHEMYRQRYCGCVFSEGESREP